jgi:hypothetical protein
LRPRTTMSSAGLVPLLWPLVSAAVILIDVYVGFSIRSRGGHWLSGEYCTRKVV